MRNSIWIFPELPQYLDKVVRQTDITVPGLGPWLLEPDTNWPKLLQQVGSKVWHDLIFGQFTKGTPARIRAEVSLPR